MCVCVRGRAEDYIEFKAGVVAAEAHQFKKAIQHYEKAIELNKTNSEYVHCN